jgi:nicotinate-nucleotide adenylyltransferase
MQRYSIFVYKRPGFDIREDLPVQKIVLDAPLLQISATHIRELIREGKSIRYLVPDIVKAEIEANHYYK